jgi:hypothetical protein
MCKFVVEGRKLKLLGVDGSLLPAQIVHGSFSKVGESWSQNGQLQGQRPAGNRWKALCGRQLKQKFTVMLRLQEILGFFLDLRLFGQKLCCLCAEYGTFGSFFKTSWKL